MYRYISRESCSQFDSLPLTSLTISGVSAHQRSTVGEPRRAVQRSLREPRGVGRSRGAGLRRAAPAVGSERGVSRNVARLGTRSARGGAGVQQARNRRVRRLRKLTRTRTHTHTHTLSLSHPVTNSFLLLLILPASSFLLLLLPPPSPQVQRVLRGKPAELCRERCIVAEQRIDALDDLDLVLIRSRNASREQLGANAPREQRVATSTARRRAALELASY